MNYVVKSLDVWGHAPSECCAGYGCGCVDEDGTHDTDACTCGFEVNDMWKVGTVEIPKDATDAEILRILDDSGFIHAHLCEVDDYSDGTTLDIVSPETGRPLLTLDAEDEQ